MENSKGISSSGSQTHDHHRSLKVKITPTPIQETSSQLLPEEIIMEILTRLPVKSLLKFRVMFTINSEPAFNLKDCSLHSLMFEPSTDASDIIDYPMKHPERLVEVVGSCNALLCILVSETDHEYEDHLFLWNPAKRMSVELPPVDPGVGHFQYANGFGYAEATDDYKVVAAYKFWEKHGIAVGYESVLMYSLKTNSWKMIEGGFKGGVAAVSKYCTIASGKIHLPTKNQSDSVSKWDIVSIDLDTEVFGMVEQPTYDEGSKPLILSVVGGCICVVCDFMEVLVEHVWVLREYGNKESWTKMFTIPYSPGLVRTLYTRPLVILGNGETLLFRPDDHIGVSSLEVYNFEDNSLRNPQTRNLPDASGAQIYVESLVSPTLFQSNDDDHGEGER